MALLQAVLLLPVLTPERALQLLDYYLERNRIARKSPAKTWKRKQKKVTYQSPLENLCRPLDTGGKML